MKVAEYIGIFGTGGIEHVVLQLFQFIDHETFQIDFVIDFAQEVACREEIYSNNGRILSIFSKPGVITKGYQKFLKAWYFYKLLKREKYDIIHMHISYPSTLLYCLVAKMAGVKVRIVQSHTNDYGNVSRAYRKINEIAKRLLLHSATHLLAVSNKAGDWMFGKRKYDILSNGIEVSKFSYSKSEREYLRIQNNISQDAIVIGHVGRYSYAKNQEFLIDIFEKILEQEPRAILMLTGEGGDSSLKERIIHKIEKLGIMDHVLMMPFTPNVAQLYQMMDAFVFPSRYEGFGIVVLEAQVSGLPIWISDRVPPEVQVTNNVHRLSLENSAKEWADNILGKLDGFLRQDYTNHIHGKGIDIKEKSKWLETYYTEILKV